MAGKRKKQRLHRPDSPAVRQPAKPSPVPPSPSETAGAGWKTLLAWAVLFALLFLILHGLENLKE